MYYKCVKKGFTLIELLVVVLIVGILAAVALPQYQKAVIKARYANAISIVETLNKAQGVYFLANNHYTQKFADLDIELDGKLHEATDGDAHGFDWGYCKMHNTGYGMCQIDLPNGKGIWYFEYWGGAGRSCWVVQASNNSLGRTLCQYLTGNTSSSSSGSYEIYAFK